MPPAQIFWTYILVSMASGTVLAFICFHITERRDVRNRLNFLYNSVLLALTVGVLGGGVLGFLIFLIVYAKHN
jgi:hypothetical protein